MDRAWTAALVLAGLEEAFRANQGLAIHSPVKADLRPALAGEHLTGQALIGVVAAVLGRGTPEHKALIGAAASVAYGRSIAEEARRLNWDRSTFDRRRDRGAELVAEALRRLQPMQGG